MQREESSLSNQPAGATFLRTCLNGINALSGVGLLTIPYALAQGGWLSLILFFLVATLCWYTGLLLKRCMDSHPSLKTYPDIGEKAFGYSGRAIVSMVMYLELYLVAVEFLILEGDNLSNLFPKMGFKIGNLEVKSKQAFVLLSTLVILPTTWMKNLNVLAYVSSGGVLASIAVVFFVFWAGAFDGVGFHHHSNSDDYLWRFRGLPTTVSLFTFSYGGHAVFPLLYDSMRDKTRFSKVLIVMFVASTINYGSMGVLGYLMYGSYSKSQITLNLPINKLSTKLAIYTTLVGPFAKYAIITSPISAVLEENIPLSHIRLVSILIRTLLVISTVVVALAVPFFGYVMAFIGAFLNVFVSILFPCLCYLKINRSAREFGFELIIICGMLLIGIIVGVTGTCSSIIQIVHHLV